jgi:hypothetical protein
MNQRFTTDQKEIHMLSGTIRTVDHLTPKEKADNAAHEAGLKKIFEGRKKEE